MKACWAHFVNLIVHFINCSALFMNLILGYSKLASGDKQLEMYAQ